jgi:hypothetical protein
LINSKDLKNNAIAIEKPHTDPKHLEKFKIINDKLIYALGKLTKQWMIP